jgi:hypothetical protein
MLEVHVLNLYYDDVTCPCDMRHVLINDFSISMTSYPNAMITVNGHNLYLKDTHTIEIYYENLVVYDQYLHYIREIGAFQRKPAIKRTESLVLKDPNIFPLFMISTTNRQLPDTVYF